MTTKSEKMRNFQNFLKRKIYDLRLRHTMFKTSPYAITGIGKEFFVYGVPINDARIDAIDYAVITGELY